MKCTSLETLIDKSENEFESSPDPSHHHLLLTDSIDAKARQKCVGKERKENGRGWERGNKKQIEFGRHEKERELEKRERTDFCVKERACQMKGNIIKYVTPCTNTETLVTRPSSKFHDFFPDQIMLATFYSLFPEGKKKWLWNASWKRFRRWKDMCIKGVDHSMEPPPSFFFLFWDTVKVLILWKVRRFVPG